MMSIIRPLDRLPSEDLPTTPGGSGRIKEAPVCQDASLKSASTSTVELQRVVFHDCQALRSKEAPAATHVNSISSGSSTHSESEAPETPESKVSHRTITSQRKTSRQGRATQRWATDPDSHEPIRLVTGCVPILRDGRVLFVSASRKSEWILPKGGWEQDETMQESATRECFEEAGVLGVLRPALTEVQYETRKSKKRRKEHEELSVQVKRQANDKHSLSSDELSSEPTSPAILSEETLRLVRQGHMRSSPKPGEDCVSVASSRSAGTYSQVRMVLFPMYVTEVAETWPESGRFRRAVDIDTAISMMDGRPEFKTILREVQLKGLCKVDGSNVAE